MPARRFPPPWSVEDTGAAFVVKDGGTLLHNPLSTAHRETSVLMPMFIRAASAAHCCTSKEFFGNQDREGRTNGTSNDADRLSRKDKAIQSGMIAGPRLNPLCRARLFKAANNVTVGIEYAHLRHLGSRQALLPAGFAQQGERLKHRRRIWVLIVEDWRPRHEGHLIS